MITSCILDKPRFLLYISFVIPGPASSRNFTPSQSMRIDVDSTALSESGIALSKSAHQNKGIVFILSDIVCRYKLSQEDLSPESKPRTCGLILVAEKNSVGRLQNDLIA